jgi:hypothetical protein
MKHTLFATLLLCLLSATSAVQAQYGYSINSWDTNTITITSYSGAQGDLTIPSSINNLLVTVIGPNVFGGSELRPNRSLYSVTIPEGVVSIGENAFGFCFELTSVSIPASVTNIGESAFTEGFFSTLNIPGPAYIGAAAFETCPYLSSINIPFVTGIADSAFSYCTSLTQISIPPTMVTLGQMALGECSFTNVTIANGVTSLNYEDFYGDPFGTITIPASVTNLAAQVFSESGVSNVFFGGNAPTADPSIYSGDNGITNYYLPGTTGWGTNFAGFPAVLWNPVIQTGSNFGVAGNQFGFDVAGTANIPIVVQECTNLLNPSWISLKSMFITNGLAHFSEPYPFASATRYYQITAP